MGCCRYTLHACLVAVLSVVALRVYRQAISRPDYGYAYAMPDWWWKARLPEHIEAIEAADTAKLKSVLFGGEPWLLQCYSGLPFAGQHLPRPYRVHPYFAESLRSMKGIVRAGVLDCETMLPSNKTVVSKLGLVRRTQPLLVLANGGAAPKQLPATSSDSAYAITAFVKPKVEPHVLSIQTHKTFVSTCGGRRPCLLAQLDKDSQVLMELARSFRTIEVVALGQDSQGSKLAWGRGDEIGETLDEDEARHLGKRISVVLPDPDDIAERAAAKKAGSKTAGKRPANPPRLLRGFEGPEDVPSLSRFVSAALKDAGSAVLRSGTDSFMRIPLPTLSSSKKVKSAGEKKQKKTPAATRNNNADVQARRARERREKAEKEAAAAEAEAEAAAKARGATDAEVQNRREAARREQMQREQEMADNLVEEVYEDDDEEAVDESEELEMEDLDLDN